MPCSTCGHNHAAGTPCATAPTPPATPPADTPTFSVDDFGAFQEFMATRGQQPQRPVVPAGRPVAQVNEAPAYRFDGSRGEFEFSSDMIAASFGDGAARQRVEEFIAGLQFNVATTDVNELNPNRQRPDLYVDQLDYDTPVWDAIYKGTLPDKTPFDLPKWNSSSGLVGDHTEGVEPSTGAFTTTGQTVTPTAVSGKVTINRESWDQGGSPQLSMLIWNEIQRAYREALEVKAVDLLDGLSPTAIALSGADVTLDQNLTAAMAALQYIRGGMRLRDFVLASNLFSALIAAADDNGRRLYPLIAPSNATGTAGPLFGNVNIGGLAGKPAWALESGNGGDGSSYLFNRGDVHGWATPLQRIDMPAIAVATVSIGVFGYVATACTRLAGVREVTYSA